MFFDDEDERFGINPELFHVVRRELYSISSNLDVTPYGLRSVPTHTEDGIPIRKIYVTNLPPKVSRAELFGVFTQYGFIRSCWLRLPEKTPARGTQPSYAFITYSNPADAHKALQAPCHEKTLRGRNLKIYPADSWHQPVEDADGSVHWKPRAKQEDEKETNQQESPVPETSANNSDTNNTEICDETAEPATEPPVELTPESDETYSYNVMDILNEDCLRLVLSYVPLRDLIRSEAVSKRWQSLIHEHLKTIRVYKTSWWQHIPVTLTTAVLRRLLQRLGGSLQRLHIDHHWSALNDRTAHTVGKFCPNLEELKIIGMHTKNWNPITYGCKQLKTLSFVSCNKLTDSSLVHLVKEDSSIERLTVANNTHVTGLFLTGLRPLKLTSLSFYNCYSLQGTVLSAAIDSLPSLTTLKLDVCPVTMWKIVPLILNKLPKLEELSLSEYTSVELCLAPQGNEAFCEALANLNELRTLNLSRNIYITNAVLKQIAKSCLKIESLNVSSCNSRKTFTHKGVSDEGISAVCANCPLLSRLDVSYLASLTDAGVAQAAKCTQLRTLVARGVSHLSALPLAQLLAACHQLEEIDVCGSDTVSEEVAVSAVQALTARPRPLLLRLAGTMVTSTESLPTHKLLVVNIEDDLSNPHLRPDFVDRIYEDSSEDSLEDFYDHDDIEDFLGAEDELFLDDDLDDYEALYAYGMHGPDIILL